MRRTTITIPDDVAEILTREARRRETSVSALIRQFIEAGLDLTQDRRRTIPWAGLFDDPEMVSGRRLDEELERHWADEIAGDR